MRPAGVVLIAAGWLVDGCGGPAEGSAFGEIRSTSAGFSASNTVAPGQELILLFATVTNLTEEPLTLNAVEAETSAESENAAEVVGVRVGRRTGAGRATLGPHALDPPATEADGRCAAQELFDPAGVVVSSGNEWAIAIHVRPRATGIWSLDRIGVVYEQGGEQFRQDIPFAFELPVGPPPGLAFPAEDRPCVTAENLLPGWD